MDPEEPQDETCCEDGNCGMHSGHPEEFPEGLSLSEAVSWAVVNESAVPIEWTEKNWCGGKIECFYAGVVPNRWDPEEWVRYFIESVLFIRKRYESTKPDATVMRTSDAVIVTVHPKTKEAIAFLYDAVDTMKSRRRKISVKRIDENRLSKIRNKRDSLYGTSWSRVEAQLSSILATLEEMMAKNEEQFKDLITENGATPSVLDVMKEQALEVIRDEMGNLVEIDDAQADSLES